MTFLATITIAADADTVRLVTDPAPGNFLVQLADGTGAVIDTRSGPDLVYSFSGLPAGDYSVTAVLTDVNGAAIGGVSSANFTAADVPPETLTVKSVSAVSVVVTPE